MLLLGLKRAIWLKTSYVHAFGKLLVFVDRMYHTLENNVTKTQKTRLRWSKSKLVLLSVLKRAIGLKTSYGDAFGKLRVFVDLKYQTLENNVDRKSTRLNSSHSGESRMPSSA